MADTGGTSFVSLDTSVRVWHRALSRGGLPRRHRAGPSASLDVERDESRAAAHCIGPGAIAREPSFERRDRPSFDERADNVVGSTDMSQRHGAAKGETR